MIKDFMYAVTSGMPAKSTYTWNKLTRKKARYMYLLCHDCVTGN